MKCVSIAIIAMASLLGGCGQHVIIDWVDFVQLNDIHALHDDSNELFELKVYSDNPIYRSTDKIRISATLKYGDINPISISDKITIKVVE
ncbi:hypothetical protein [Desulfitobacterium hafniense]|nr:hypothetical protein [Desulfitobacterium hafniense]ACL20175.1 hypothetical protein Dhaf_2141 [Desulfitobacterium hafniense DCB-2]EHL05755.1 hypothetical protein HMPREF0322_03515 [Desulfitobacterium hafniense DP7]MEA5021806.1 hypothetical protein [Desulfitobacterium hafniense]CDX00983.1 Prokaryotic membrane lipoprotein lipid attachment site profile [Desulfitobacterium hafniense]